MDFHAYKTTVDITQPFKSLDFWKSVPRQAGPLNSPQDVSHQPWWVLLRGGWPGGKEQAAGPHPQRCWRRASSVLLFLLCCLLGVHLHCCQIPRPCFLTFWYPEDNLKDILRQIPEPAITPSLWAASHSGNGWRALRFASMNISLISAMYF